MPLTRRLTALIAAALCGLAFGGCVQKSSSAPPGPAPQLRYLGLDRSAQAGEQSERPLTQSSASSRSAQEADGAQTRLSPEEIARRVAELNEAVSKLQQSQVARAGEGSSRAAEVTTSSQVAAQPSVQTPTQVASGKVTLTAIEPVVEAKPAQAAQQASGVQTASPALAAAHVALPSPPAPSAAQAAAAAPAATGPAALPPTLEQLTAHYEEMSRKNAGDAETARTLRFLYFLGGQNEKCLEAISGLPVEEQELWRGLMWTLVNARDRAPGMTRMGQAAETLAALDEVRTTLQKAAPMELGDMRFCERINGFGDYLPRPTNRFQGRESVRLYAEIRNFTTEKGTDSLYHVRLIERLVLESQDGKVVWQQGFDNIDDVCRRARHDFFLTTRFSVPELVPGRYVLKVTVEDVPSRKSATTKLDMEVSGIGVAESPVVERKTAVP